MKKNNYNTLSMAYIKIILCVIFFSSSFHTASFLIKYTDPYSIIFLRFFSAFLVLLIFNKIFNGVFFNYQILKKNSFLFLAIGIFGFFFYFLFFLISSERIPVIIIAIVFAFTPSLSSIASIIFLKDRLKLLSYVGLIIALLGTIAIINVKMSCGRIFCINFFSQFNSKYSLALLIVFPAVLYNILTKVASRKGISSTEIVLNSSIIAAISALIFLIINHPIIYKPLISEFWIGIIYFAIPCTALGYILLTEAIKTLGINKAIIFQNMIPIIAILIETVIYHKKITFLEFCIIGVIIFGIILTNLPKQS